MTSGIYKLQFSDDSIYIGKSSNIDKRWSQHSKAMLKGSHTKKIQEAYSKYGDPIFSIICTCHPDHLDILENYYINYFWCSKILNTTRPPELTDREEQILKSAGDNVWAMSTFEHIMGWSNAADRADLAEERFKKTKNASLVHSLEFEVASLKDKLDKLSKRSWYDRLFNIGV